MKIKFKLSAVLDKIKSSIDKVSESTGNTLIRFEVIDSDIKTGAEQVNIAVNKVNEISAKNRENIDLLVREVSLFKVE